MNTGFRNREHAHENYKRHFPHVVMIDWHLHWPPFLTPFYIYYMCHETLCFSSHLRRWGTRHKTLLNLRSSCFADRNASKHVGYHSLRKSLTFFFSVELLTISMKLCSGCLFPDERQSWPWLSHTSYATKGIIRNRWLNLTTNPPSCPYHTGICKKRQSQPDVAQVNWSFLLGTKTDGCVWSHMTVALSKFYAFILLWNLLPLPHECSWWSPNKDQVDLNKSWFFF